MAIKLEFLPQPQGVVFSLSSLGLFGGSKPVPFEKWESTDAPCKGAIGLLLRVHEENSCVANDNALTLPHDLIANLSQAEAFLLHLPPVTPLHISLRSHGNISQKDFRIDTAWLTPQGARAAISRVGSMMHYQGQWQRLPHTLYNICEAIEAHNALPSDQKDEKRKYLASITVSLPEDARKQISKDGFLANLRVYHAAALSLHLISQEGELNFTPVLFGQSLQSQTDVITEEDVDLVTEGQSLLPPKHQAKFIQHFTHTYHDTRSSYVLGDNRYVFLEPMLQDCLEVVRKMCSASSEVKRQFIRTPQRFFKERLASKYAEDALEAMFVPTQEYSDRVTGIGLWVKKALPWIIQASNQWVPEYYGVSSGELKIILTDSAAAATAKEAVLEAMNIGQESVYIDGSVPEGEVATELSLEESEQFVPAIEVPATQDTVDILASIERLLETQKADEEEEGGDECQKEDEKTMRSGPIFLGTEDNEEQIKCSGSDLI